MGKVKEKSLFDAEELIPSIKPMGEAELMKKIKKKAQEDLYIFKVICGSTGVRIKKIKIGSVTKKNYIYQNGQGSSRIQKEVLDKVVYSEPSHEKLHNAVIIYTLRDLEEDKEHRLSISRLVVSSYRNYINEYMKEYNKVEKDLERIGIDLLMDKMDVNISIL